MVDWRVWRKVMPMLKKLSRLIFLGALASVMYGLVARPRLLRWGARDDETQRALPGDDRVSQPMYETTRAISIRASAARVWQWLVQIGVGRGGFYTYDALEDIAGLDIHSADQIYPEWQTLRVGDAVHISPVTPLKVEVLEPNRTLVLHIVMSPFTAEIVNANDPATRAFFDWTWAFILDDLAPMTTRLIVRVRGNFQPTAFKFVAPIILEPIHFLMERGMLHGIQRRAEQDE